MQLSLQSLRLAANQAVSWETTCSMDELCQEISHLHGLNPIRTKGQVKKIKANLYQVTGELSTHVTYICSRCLKEFARPLSTQWEVQVRMTDEGVNPVEEEEIPLMEGNVIDLVPMIREALLLKIPFAPICQEDCKGLCSVCGVDRNETACDCQEKPIDPRWSKLQFLSKED